MKNLYQFLLFILVPCVLAGLALIHDGSPFGISLFLGSATGLVALYFADKKLDQRLADEHKVEVAAMVEKQIQAAHGHDYALEVRGSIWAFLGAIFFIVISAGMIFAGLIMPNLFVAIVGIIFLLLALLLGLQSLLGLGHPLITLTREGFSTAIEGDMPWSEVQGIHLQANRHRETILSHTLSIYVPNLSQRYPDFSVGARLLYALRLRKSKTIVRIVLAKPNKDPEVVERIAKELWRERTGRDFYWDPSSSQEYNDAMRRIAELPSLEKLTTLGDNPEKFIAASDQFVKDSDVVQRELTKNLRNLKWMQIAAVIAFVIFVLAKIMK